MNQFASVSLPRRVVRSLSRVSGSDESRLSVTESVRLSSSLLLIQTNELGTKVVDLFYSGYTDKRWKDFAMELALVKNLRLGKWMYTVLVCLWIISDSAVLLCYSRTGM